MFSAMPCWPLPTRETEKYLTDAKAVFQEVKDSHMMQNPNATYACLNLKDAAAPREIAERSICIQGDIGAVLESL